MTHRIFRDILYRYKLTSIYRNTSGSSLAASSFFFCFLSSSNHVSRLFLSIAINYCYSSPRYSFPRDFHPVRTTVVTFVRTVRDNDPLRSWRGASIIRPWSSGSLHRDTGSSLSLSLYLSLLVCQSFLTSRFRTGLPWSSAGQRTILPLFALTTAYTISNSA